MFYVVQSLSYLEMDIWSENCICIWHEILWLCRL